VGIDIEKQRSKILKIAHKFTTLAEYSTLANEDAIIRKLTIVWGTKEAVYKSFARPGISFLEHIFVEDFRLDDPGTSAKVYADNKSETYDVYFQEFEEFTLVYAITA
jgi:phosphopantetheinyl transferase (holo-ACP synthase)